MSPNRPAAPPASDERRMMPPAVEVRDMETNGTRTLLSGVAVPYERSTDIGWFLESFAPGAFAKSIGEAARDLPLLLFHNAASMPIGATKEWQDSGTELRGVWRLDDSPEAQRGAELADKGMLSGLSVRFAPIRSEWTYVDDFAPDLGPTHKDSVRRTEARLIETSLVSTPAYESAAVEWVRSAERALHPDAAGKELAGWRQYLESVRGG